MPNESYTSDPENFTYRTDHDLYQPDHVILYRSSIDPTSLVMTCCPGSVYHRSNPGNTRQVIKTIRLSPRYMICRICENLWVPPQSRRPSSVRKMSHLRETTIYCTSSSSYIFRYRDVQEPYPTDQNRQTCARAVSHKSHVAKHDLDHSDHQFKACVRPETSRSSDLSDV